MLCIDTQYKFYGCLWLDSNHLTRWITSIASRSLKLFKEKERFDVHDGLWSDTTKPYFWPQLRTKAQYGGVYTGNYPDFYYVHTL